METLFKTYRTTVAYSPVEVDNQIIVPVVMMVEGVHSGSHGPIYHSVEALESGVRKWEGKPITLRHPTNSEGFFVSVVEVTSNEWVIGAVHNVRIENNKLKASAHFDVQRLIALNPEVLEQIRQGKIIEVSIGIFATEEQKEGLWNNEVYKSVAINHEPDHLALLPGEIGACSVTDGCGLRLNEVSNNVEKKEVEMCEKCKEKAKALVVNANTNFTESDLNWLEELPEDKLDKLIPKVKTVEVFKEVEVEVTKEKALEVLGINKAQYEKGLEIYNARRTEVIDSIIANTEKDLWSKDVLDEMRLEVLEKIEKSVVKEKSESSNVYVSVNDFQNERSLSGIAPMPIAGVEFKTK